MKTNKGFTVIVLAAGKGKRMKSSLPKVLHKLGSKPIIYYLLRELKALKNDVKQIIVVVGHKANDVTSYIKSEFKGIDFVDQGKPLGTAHGVAKAMTKVKNDKVLVMCGDAPLIMKNTVKSFMQYHLRKKNCCSLLTAYLKSKDLGVVAKDANGKLCSITERVVLGKKDIDCVNEVNSGIYAFGKKCLKHNLGKIGRNKKKGEYFLTDIIDILYKKGCNINSYPVDDAREILGINSNKDLLDAQSIMRQRVVNSHIEAGIKIIDANNTYIEDDVKIGKNTTVFPFTFIEKGVIIGSNCQLGPFIRIRKGTKIKANVCLGNFIEVNRSTLGNSVTMKHFGYLGDTVVGDDSNIGAGTVVANYDGKNKNKTNIGKGAFIGSDSILVAPVNIGKGAVTGAGSVVTKDVKQNTVVVGVPAKPLKKRRGKE